LGNQWTTTVKCCVNAFRSKPVGLSPDVFDKARIARIHISCSFNAAMYANVRRPIEEIADSAAVESSFDPFDPEPFRKPPIGKGLRIASIYRAEVAIPPGHTNVLGSREEVGDGSAPQGCIDAVGAKCSPAPLRDWMRSSKVLLTCIDCPVTSHTNILFPFEEIALGSAVESGVDAIFLPNSAGHYQLVIGCGYPESTEPGPVSSRLTLMYLLPEKK
jgi:hypothetical protein